MSVLYRILATVFALLIVFCAAIVCLSFLTRNLPVSDLLIFVISAIFATTTTWLFYKKEFLWPTTAVGRLAGLSALAAVALFCAGGLLVFRLATPNLESPPDLLANACDRATAATAELPAFVDPAEPSGRISLPLAWLGGDVRTVADAAERIELALRGAGYFEYSFHYLRCGFALVTRLEQINDDGTPLNGSYRWNNKLITGMRIFSLSEYLKVLFLAPTGRYRIIVFVLAPHELRTVRREMSREVAERWLAGGELTLNRIFKEIRLKDPPYTLSALIYEFYVSGREESPALLRPGTLPSDVHLRAAGLLCETIRTSSDAAQPSFSRCR